MNPGKVVDPFRVDEHLRMGTDYAPLQLPTHFKYPKDNGSFAYAMERCVGVGNCRKAEGGTMCPSYMVTREERHSTRGRARLLFEMLNGDVLSDRRHPWKAEAVHEALSLCLACKACKSECPVQVDMATYKAEFLSHYYEGRLRERAAYSMGLIQVWARVASRLPRISNFLSQTQPFAAALKAVAGIASERDLPKFAKQPFTKWFNERGPSLSHTASRRVILWPDTFNNFFRPETAQATVAVLEAAGFAVSLPPRPLCCARPLYDYGMLDRAKALLRQTLDALRPELRAGAVIVGMEPSCVAVFRDELANLFPNDEDAKRLVNSTFLLSEFLQNEASDWELPKLRKRAIVHRHCHHDAVFGFEADEAVLKRLELDYEVLDSGCCGMAGSFGFEKNNYHVSKACAERVLVPRIEKLDTDTLILADGFSCRSQIEAFTGRAPPSIWQKLYQWVWARRCPGANSPIPLKTFTKSSQCKLKTRSDQ